MSQFFDKAREQMATKPEQPFVQPLAPDKCIRACNRGLVKIRNKTLHLRQELHKLEAAELFLYKMKFSVQRALVPIQVIPPGRSGKASKVVMPDISSLTKDQAVKLLAELEARMKGA